MMNLITKKDLKIYNKKNDKCINYPDRFIDGIANIKLQLKVLKDNIESNTDLGYLEDNLKLSLNIQNILMKKGKFLKEIFIE